MHVAAFEPSQLLVLAAPAEPLQLRQGGNTCEYTTRGKRILTKYNAIHARNTLRDTVLRGYCMDTQEYITRIHHQNTIRIPYRKLLGIRTCYVRNTYVKYP